ncbi:hypothetical protein IIO_02037 [Bacillus cereus VD115]|nr:hypothetical protein IIO_02037 [Bacillus cereus VD115]
MHKIKLVFLFCCYKLLRELENRFVNEPDFQSDVVMRYETIMSAVK